MEFLKNHQVVAAMTETNDPRCNITGGQVGDWICMKGYNRLAFLIVIDAWVAGDSAVTLQQSTDIANSLGDAKALTYAENWRCAAYSLEAAPVWVKTAAALTIANANTPDNEAYLIEIEADMLDADNKFDCVKIVFGTPGAQNNYLNCIAILSDPRYGGLESQMVDPVAN